MVKNQKMFNRSNFDRKSKLTETSKKLRVYVGFGYKKNFLWRKTN